MIDDGDLRDPSPKPLSGTPTAAHVVAGMPTPKVARVKQFSPSDWEEFTEEYASALASSYAKVRLFAGAGDTGIDVACFINDGTFDGGWDNHQCKRFKGALQPNRAWVEIGKIIYYSFIKEYPPPRPFFDLIYAYPRLRM